MPKEFDQHERAAIQAVASQLPADNFTFPPDELPAFVQFIVQEFGERLRQELDKAPPY